MKFHTEFLDKFMIYLNKNFLIFFLLQFICYGELVSITRDLSITLSTL
jgi:hypothetical protein